MSIEFLSYAEENLGISASLKIRAELPYIPLTHNKLHKCPNMKEIRCVKKRLSVDSAGTTMAQTCSTWGGGDTIQ